MHIVLFKLKICITSACLPYFALVAIITNQYWACTMRVDVFMIDVLGKRK